MIKILFDPENPHNLTSQGGKITQDINIRTWWSPELGILNESGQLQVLINFACWITDVYNITGMQPPQIQIDQFEKGKFKTFADNSETEAGNIFALMESFVFQFTKKYLVENYEIDPNLIEYLPM